LQVNCGSLSPATGKSWDDFAVPGAVRDLVGLRFGALEVVSRAVNRVRPDGMHEAQWFCQCDCGRARVVRAVHLSTGRVTSCGDRSVHGRSGVLTYAAAHQRVTAARGPASAQHCADCLTEPASQWSYEGDDPNEQQTPTGLRFSGNVWAYTARCHACHEALDAARRRGDHSRTTVLF
jgi:hypothetical protein